MKLRFLQIMGIISLLGFILVVGGCGGDNCNTEDRFIEVHKALNKLRTYSAKAVYRVIDEDEIREYEFRQWVEIPNKFKVEIISPKNLAGKTIISDGKDIVIHHPGVQDSLRFEVEDFKQQRPLFIGDFMSDYWLSEEVGKEIRVEDKKEYVVLTCPVSNTADFQSSQSLWMDPATMSPAKLITYDADGNVTTLIVFKEFKRNWKVPENFFKPVTDIP